MKAHKTSLLYDVLTDWRTWATAGFSLCGWLQLAGGHWTIASIAFCAASWVQCCAKK